MRRLYPNAPSPARARRASAAWIRLHGRHPLPRKSRSPDRCLISTRARAALGPGPCRDPAASPRRARRRSRRNAPTRRQWATGRRLRQTEPPDRATRRPRHNGSRARCLRMAGLRLRRHRTSPCPRDPPTARTSGRTDRATTAAARPVRARGAARATPAGRTVRRGSSCPEASASSAPHSGQDRRRAIEIAELDVEIRHQRLEVGRAQIGGGAGDVAGVGLLDRELADRPPLRVVARQQLRAGDPLEHERELPGQVVCVLDAGIAAEAAVRRHQVGGVAGEEDATVLKAARHVGGRPPPREPGDLHRQVRVRRPRHARARQVAAR